MKKKSLFGFSAKLALMLVAVCGLLTSCYTKEELTADVPSTVAPEYKITGFVSDAATGLALSGVAITSTTAQSGATSDQNGVYTLSVTDGLNVVTFTKGDYTTVNVPILVSKIENGQTAVYTANAAMISNKIPTYKTVKYSIEGVATNDKGNAVALTSAIFNGGLKATVSGNKYTLADIQPGTYTGVLSAKGYKNAYITINVNPVKAEEGDPLAIQKATTTFDVLLQGETVQTSKYIVSGIITNKANEFLKGATVTIQVNGFNTTTTSGNYGYYSTEVAASYIAPGALAVITVTMPPYSTQTKAQIINVVESGATGLISIPFEMVVPEDVEEPSVDVDNGGNTTVDVPVEEAVSTKPADIKDEVAKEQIDKIAEDLGIDLTENEIPVIESVAPIVVELASTEAVVNESTGEATTETKTVTDQITLPANTQVYYVAGTAQNINVSRDITTEKAVAAVRVFEGQPSGTVFSKPMEINFPAPATVTVEPDYVLGVLYLNEKTNEWVADQGNYAEYNMTSKTFVGNITHFSKFRFGYESEIANVKEGDLTASTIDKACFTGSTSAIVTLKGKYLGGAAYEGNTPDLAVAEKLAGMNDESKSYVSLLLKNMIKADNANIMPSNNYTTTNISVDKRIPANTQVENFSMVRTEIVKSYTVHVINKDKTVIDVTVKVKKISKVTITPNLKANHGHGHGDDLNAGGGIIEFE